MSAHGKINIALIGATGYTGLDLVLMLSKHPKVRIKYLCATRNLGKKIIFFDKRIKKRLPKISPVNSINWNILDVVFLSLPNGEAQKLINKIYKKNRKLKFIDLSADFRIINPKISKFFLSLFCKFLSIYFDRYSINSLGLYKNQKKPLKYTFFVNFFELKRLISLNFSL